MLSLACYLKLKSNEIVKMQKFFSPGSGPLDVRIKRLASQRDDLQDTVRRLKLDLEEEHSKSSLQRGLAMQEEIERLD